MLLLLLIMTIIIIMMFMMMMMIIITNVDPRLLVLFMLSDQRLKPRGIFNQTQQIAIADRLGYCIKLLGIVDPKRVARGAAQPWLDEQRVFGRFGVHRAGQPRLWCR